MHKFMSDSTPQSKYTYIVIVSYYRQRINIIKNKKLSKKKDDNRNYHPLFNTPHTLSSFSLLHGIQFNPADYSPASPGDASVGVETVPPSLPSTPPLTAALSVSANDVSTTKVSALYKYITSVIP